MKILTLVPLNIRICWRLKRLVLLGLNLCVGELIYPLLGNIFTPAFLYLAVARKCWHSYLINLTSKVIIMHWCGFLDIEERPFLKVKDFGEMQFPIMRFGKLFLSLLGMPWTASFIMDLEAPPKGFFPWSCAREICQ